jgi:hypothetical protein
MKIRLIEDELYPVFYKSESGENEFEISYSLWTDYVRAREVFIALRDKIQEVVEC